MMDLIGRITERGTSRRFREMGYSKAVQARGPIKQHIYMVLGVEVMRGVDRLLLTNLSIILVGPTSGKVTLSRRTNVKVRYESR